MDPNYIGIRRVYTRPENGLAAVQTLDAGDPMEIVVEWDAGAALNGDCVAVGDIRLEIFTCDVTNSPLSNIGGLTFSVAGGDQIDLATDGAHRDSTYEHVEPVGGPWGAANTTYEITARLFRRDPATDVALSVSFAKWMFCGY